MAIDPICGMTVDEASALRAERDGQTFYFCSEHCRKTFLSTPATAKHEEKPQGKAIYTCPMHPEVQQEHPGDCPKCGMTLEPKTVTAGTDDEENTELHGMTSHLANYPNQPASSEEMLDALQRDAFGYFLHETNAANGLVADKTQPDAPASIAAVGFALSVYLVGVERSWMTRAEAAQRTLAVLRFFWNSPQGTAPDATGYKGFYYHFLDMKTGRRDGRCELSTVDTAFLLAGMLTAAIYFDQDCEDELEIRTLADALYRRTDWRWAQNREATITHGWKPESGFLQYRWGKVTTRPCSSTCSAWVRRRTRAASNQTERHEKQNQKRHQISIGSAQSSVLRQFDSKADRIY